MRSQGDKNKCGANGGLKIMSTFDGKHIVKKTTKAMRYSVFMNREDISARYLNFALCI